MAGKFEIKSFKGGKSEFVDRGIVGSFKMAKNVDIRSEIDALACTQALITDGNAASIVVDLIHFHVDCSDGNSYYFGNTGKIYKRTALAVWSVVYTDSDGAILGAAEWYDATTTYLVWATSTKLNRTAIPSNWTTDVNAGGWQKVNLTAADWHTMAQADGSLMICNSKKLAQVGYDGSYTNEALALRYGVIAKTVSEYGNSVLVGGGDGVKNSWLLTWDHSAQNWTGKNRIPVKSINAVVDAEIMLMNCGDNELFFSNMTDKMRVATMDGKCNPGGVVEDHGLAYFGLYGGSYSGIWSYGRKDKNGVHSLNLEHYLDADEIGAVWFIGSVLFVSYRKGATKAVLKVNTAAKAVAEYYSLDLKAPRETVWESVQMLTDTLPADSKIEVFYSLKSLKLADLSVAENWTEAILQGGSDFVSGRDPVFMLGSNGRICNLKIVITPATNSSPVIHELSVNFQ